MNGGDLDAAAEEFGMVFEKPKLILGIPGDGSDGRVVEADRSGGHLLFVSPSPFFRGGFLAGLRGVLARFFAEGVHFVKLVRADRWSFQERGEEVVKIEGAEKADQGA